MKRVSHLKKNQVYWALLAFLILVLVSAVDVRASANMPAETDQHGQNQPESPAAVAEVQVYLEPANADQGAATQPNASSAGYSSAELTDQVLKVFLGLAAVLAVIFLLAWLGGAQNSQIMRPLAVYPLGARERLLLLAVGEQQILLALSPQQGVQCLHVFAEPVIHPETDAPATPTSFAKVLASVQPFKPKP
ncbi:Flagellar biogenesis protein FliO [Allopseudospirillum japonicum]|uniref:Flagellar biogenesis protein FliO n=1 Tax=Allopseudospirillum japonicum TaxID=64971 RepID=A0A1H6QY63_9GAMM|nr:flagellar biosynthetic protein FliO [Allopseudospirillum japonicum]SEI45914.1 Flagellar biogenesis protein FliO [Allopseudospirillum japonicum]